MLLCTQSCILRLHLESKHMLFFPAMAVLLYILLLCLLYIGFPKSSRGIWNKLLPLRSSSPVSANPLSSWQLLEHLQVWVPRRAVGKKTSGFTAKAVLR